MTGTTSFTNPQHQQKIEELVSIAKEQGYLTYEEINEILPMTFDSPEQIDQVLIYLSGMDIQVLNQAEVERQKERKREAKELEGLPKRSEGTSDDPVRMYLKEMGSVPLLTREEEVEISKRIEKAQIQIEKIIMRFRYSIREAISIAAHLIPGKERFDKIIAEKEVADKTHFLNLLPKLCELMKEEDLLLEELLIEGRDSDLKKEARAALFKRELAAGRNLDEFKKDVRMLQRWMDKSQEAKREMVESNLRLVISIAKKYTNRGLSFLDLIQEGNMGLMKAVEKFEYRRGYKFSTYATWWIRQAVTRAIADQARTIRIPVHMIETINKVLRGAKKLMMETGREPTPEELALELGLTPERVREIYKIAQHPISLQAEVGEGGESQFGDFLEDTAIESPAEATGYAILKDKINEVLATLTDRERTVLIERFGLLDGKQAKSLNENGAFS